MAKAFYAKPASAGQEQRRRVARFQAAAVRLWRAALADVRGRIPQGCGVERYDRAAKMRLAEAVDAFSGVMAEEAEAAE
jgi:hypothetical protein